jgi:hypothetical protein
MDPGTRTAAERKATERINRQVAPWRYRAELEHAIGIAAGRALAHGDTISRAELVELTVNLLVQSSNDAAHSGGGDGPAADPAAPGRRPRGGPGRHG